MKKIFVLFFVIFAFTFVYSNDLTSDDLTSDNLVINEPVSDTRVGKITKGKRSIFKSNKKDVVSVTLNSDVKIFYESLNNYIGVDFVINLTPPEYVVRGTLLKVYDDGLLIFINFPKKEVFINKNVISCIEFRKY